MEKITQQLTRTYPSLHKFGDIDWAQVMKPAKIVDLPKNTPVFRPGDACRYFLLVLEGTVKVVKLSETGQEITLYRVAAGETCELSTSCLLAEQHYPAEAITETAVQAMLIPKEAFQYTLANSDDFRRFVFSSLDRGISELVSLVEDIAFSSMDRRLAHCLMSMMDERGVIKMTHQEIAAELGTAREVVSRLLKRFEKEQWVTLGRGTIKVVNLRELCKITSHHLCNIITDTTPPS